MMSAIFAHIEHIGGPAASRKGAYCIAANMSKDGLAATGFTFARGQSCARSHSPITGFYL
jgi:hypothetical protein